MDHLHRHATTTNSLAGNAAGIFRRELAGLAMSSGTPTGPAVGTPGASNLLTTHFIQRAT
jgi:hypothetical protein